MNPDSLSQCLFCGAKYATNYCPRCGPPVGWDETEHDSRCHPDSRCTVCYTPEEIADIESFDESFDP